MEIPDQDSKGNYQTKHRRVVKDKRTGEGTNVGYYGGWYQFSGILTSMLVDGQKCEIPPDYEINICIASEPISGYADEYRAYVDKLEYILTQIKICSDVRFKGVPQRLDKSRELLPVDPANIGDAHEIYVSPNYIDTIRVEPPTRETLIKQSQYRQSKTRVNYWQVLKRIIKNTIGNILEYVKQNLLTIINIIIAFITLVVVIKQGGC